MPVWNVHHRRYAQVLGAGVITFAMTAHPHPAQGQSPIRSTAVFAIASDPSAQATATRVDAVLHAAIDGTTDFRRIEPARVTSGDPKTREEATLERARAALADGRRAYDALALDDAIARLGQAVSLYQRTGPLLGDLNELIESLAYLGSSLVLRGSADEAISTFVELLTVRSAYQPTGMVPTVERVFEQALTRVDAAPTGGVEIYSTPPYAAVYIDGSFQGVTPLTLSDLIAGTHYLRLEKTGYTIHGAPLSIAPSQRITSQTRLMDIRRGPELRDLLARGTPEVLRDRMGGALRELSQTLRSDVLIMVTVSQSGTAATLVASAFDGNTSARLATERAVVRVDQDSFVREVSSLASRLLSTVRDGGSVSSVPASEAPGLGGAPSGAFGLGTTPPPPPPGVIADPYGARRAASTPSEVYLGWTLIGLGGASAAVGAGFGVSALLVQSDLRKTEQKSPDVPNLQDTGKRNALLADILMFSGLGLAVGGTAILLISSAQDTSTETLFTRTRAGIFPTEGGAALAVGADF